MTVRYYINSEATRLIKEFTRSGSVRSTGHVKKRMKERNITMPDILCAIRNGKVTEDPELDIKTNLWKYNIIGNAVDFNNLTATVVIDAKVKCITLITVF